jgi:peptidoglycan/xylan/chitin deacetylase (PgdA/CDA1 family)
LAYLTRLPRALASALNFRPAIRLPGQTDSGEDGAHLPAVAFELLVAYQRFGGEDSLGLPIAPPAYHGDDLIQYFSRGRLDLAGRSSAAPFASVVIAELGVLLAEATGQRARPAFVAPDYLPRSGEPAYFAATGHTLSPELHDFWRERGGLERFGPPISGAITGRRKVVQWFTRARLERSVAKDGRPSVLVADLGREFMELPAELRRDLQYLLESDPVADPSTGLDVPIIYYHQVLNEALFERQIIGLLDAGYEPVPLARLVRALNGQAALPAKPLVLTFDDGWESQLRVALPVLLKYRVPATFFVMPGFDEKEPGHLDFAGFEALADAGMSVQSHTVNHADLPRLIASDLGAAQAETVESRAVLTAIGGRDYFAYPYGALDAASEDLVRSTGYLAAVSTNIGRLHFPDELFHLKRIQLNPSASIQTVLDAFTRALAIDPRKDDAAGSLS